IHSCPRFPDVLDAFHHSVGLHTDQLEGRSRFHTYETGDTIRILEGFDDRRKPHIRKAIGIVRQKHSLTFKLLLNRSESLTDVGLKPCVDEGYLPVVNVAAQ